MLRRTFLTLLGAVAWPWRKPQPAGPTSSSFTLPSDDMGGWSVTSTPPAHNDADIFFHSVRVFKNVSGRRIEAGTLVKLVDDDSGVTPV